MKELYLPAGYSLEKKEIQEREYTFLYRKGKIILSIPTENCSRQKIEEVIKQTDGLKN